MSRALSRLACAACAGLVWSCAGTEVGNPVADTRVSLTARSSDGDVALAAAPSQAHDAGGASIVIEELWVVLDDIRFVLDEDCAAQRDRRGVIEGPFAVELVARPALLTEALPSGRYCSVQTMIDRLAAADEPAIPALDGHSIVVRGRRGDGVAFAIQSRVKAPFMLRARGDSFATADASRALILAFDAGLWLRGVDLAGAAPDASGEIRVEGSGDPRLRAFEQNVRRSLKLFRDLDGDGALDEREAREALAEED